MKKIELLAPAGDINAFYAALSNGADGVYLGGTAFNARAFATNFDDETLKEAIAYAHNRSRKVFCTLNTLILDEELSEVKAYIDKLYLMGIDGLIIQDLGILHYVCQNYSDLKITASTQMTIDDIDGVLLLEKMGVNRVVLARELALSQIKEIKQNCHLEIEVFAHGALCVCFSGQCLMSSMIGGRSGNRGTCAQPCRKRYTLVDKTNNTVIAKNQYLLSMKDLNTINSLYSILDCNLDSLKIEGRMKNSDYVANVIANYRLAIDSYYTKKTIDLNYLNRNLAKTFNREFTGGHILGDSSKSLTNFKRPNNCGFYIGRISNPNYQGYVELSIETNLKQEDTIMIESSEDIIYRVVRLYNDSFRLINEVNSQKCYLLLKEKVKAGDKIYKVTDYLFEKNLSATYPKDNYRLPLVLKVIARIDQPLQLILTDEHFTTKVISSTIVEKAQKSGVTKEKIIEQLSKLNETPYYLQKIDLEVDTDIFINLKLINELRREGINNLLDLKQLKRVSPLIKNTETIDLVCDSKKRIAVKVINQQQYDIVKSLGIKDIYFENAVNSISSNHDLPSDLTLIGNYGGLNRCKIESSVSDYTLNTYNSLSVYQLLKLGIKRVTLSLELDIEKAKILYDNFIANHHLVPNLEYVIYTRPLNMISKYCLLNRFNQCGQCHNNVYELKDDYGSFPLYGDANCYMHIHHNRVINKIANLDEIKSFANTIRLEFFNESEEQIRELIASCQKFLED